MITYLDVEFPAFFISGVINRSPN